MFILIKTIEKNKNLTKSFKKSDLSVYERKPYLFDTPSEFNTYKILVELFGDKYFIFPQINYIHLIQPKTGTRGERQGYRNRIDRKSADFVFCDKDKIIPQLIIELDGSVHDFENKQEKDRFKDELIKTVGLSILRLKTNNLSKEFLKTEITNKLNRICY